jgi:hypothetical protein
MTFIPTQNTRDIQEESRALLQQAREAIGQVDGLLREQGIDPENFRAKLPSLTADELSDEVAKQFAETNHDIERDVAMKRQELGLVDLPASGSKRPRPTV